MLRRDRWMVSAAALVIAGVASSGGMGGRAALAEEPAKLEEVPGSPLKRVVLTEKAAERLAVATEPVREEPVARWMVVSGEVEAAKAGLAVPAAAGAAGAAPVLVRVPLPGDQAGAGGQATLVLSIVGKDQGGAGQGGQGPAVPGSAFVLPPGVDDRASIPARPMEVAPPAADAKAQYYQVADTAGHGLTPGQDVHVRVAQPGSGAPQKVIPYSAVFYDAQGNTWAYTNPEPLVFVRQPVDVEHIEGDVAVLKEGSVVSGEVVTAGAAELWGIESEFGGGH
jgi:hypothetical protein